MRSKRILGLGMAITIALVAVTVFMADRVSTTNASDGGATMTTTVTAGGDCDGQTCTVPHDGTFTVAVELTTAPDQGYVLAQSFLNYGTSLTYKPTEAAADEFVWADCETATGLRNQLGEGLVGHGCLTGLVPPLPVSMTTGNFVELTFNCSADDSTTEIVNVPYNEEPALTNGAEYKDGENNDIIPKIKDLTVICGEGGGTPSEETPTDTPSEETPTDTPAEETPTTEPPTPTPSDQPCGDVDGDGDVDSIDALWDLWVTAGLVEESELEKDGDINGDGDITSIDAALILQISAGLYSC